MLKVTSTFFVLKTITGRQVRFCEIRCICARFLSQFATSKPLFDASFVRFYKHRGENHTAKITRCHNWEAKHNFWVIFPFSQCIAISQLSFDFSFTRQATHKVWVKLLPVAIWLLVVVGFVVASLLWLRIDRKPWKYAWKKLSFVHRASKAFKINIFWTTVLELKEYNEEMDRMESNCVLVKSRTTIP